MEPQDNKQSTTIKIKQKIEQKVKNKVLKIILTWLITNIIPIILVLSISIILLFIIQLNMNAVKETFDSLKNTISQIFSSEGNDEKSKQDNYSIKDELKAMVKISDDGLKFEQKSEFSKIMIQKLRDAQINTTQMYYTDEDYDPEEDANNLADDELKNMIDKYIRAEVKTMFPKIQKESIGIDGCVKIKRKGFRVEYEGNGKYIDEELEYVPYEQLKAEASAIVSDDSIAEEYLKHFSLNPDTFELCLLVEEREYVWYEDEEHSGEPDKTVIKFKMNEFDYQTSLEPYATPINFFISLHQIVDDIDLMNELVSKVNNSDIVLTYYEVPTTVNSLWKYRGKVITYEDSEIETTITIQKEETVIDEETGEYKTEVVEGPTDEQIISNQTQGEVVDEEALDSREKCKQYVSDLNPAFTKNVSNTADLIVEKVDTWMDLLERVVNQGEMQPLAVVSDPDDRREGIVEGWNKKRMPDQSVANPSINYNPPAGWTETGRSSVKHIWHTKKFFITGVNSKDSFTYTTNIVDKGYRRKEDEVIEFLNKYPRAKNNLLTSPSMFYYYLEQNENTQELEKDMKIIIEKITGIKQPEGRSDYFDDNSIFSDLINKGQEIISGTSTINGKTYKNYKQPSGSDWCGITCAAIVLSGYGYNLTPREIYSKYGYGWRQAISQNIGGGDYSSDVPNGIIRQLNAGKPTIIHITPNNGLYSTKGGHYIVLLGIREVAGDTQFLVSDPGGIYLGSGRNGWVSKGKVLKYCDKYVIMK